MIGVACPECGRSALPDPTRCLEVEYGRSTACSRSGAKLTPSGWYILTWLPGCAVAFGIGLHPLMGVANWVVVVSAMAGVLVATLAGQLLAWRFVPWKPVHSAATGVEVSGR